MTYILTEGDLFKALFQNKSSQVGFIGLTPNYPAQVIPINLDNFGGKIVCKLIKFTILKLNIYYNN